MTIAEKVSKREALQKRVKRLLHLDRAGDTSELRRRILPLLNSFGSVVLIGGAIRDVARAGQKGFSSDLDFVVYDGHRRAFLEQMRAMGGVPNRFGGFALKQFSLKIDVWHIEDTWARTAGYVAVREPEDLLKCTFFDWDSVLFDLKTSRLILPQNYLAKLSLNVMDIMLEQNPNPMGSLIRALRRAALWHVRFGPRLTNFSVRCLESMSWDELVKIDDLAFATPVLRRLTRNDLLRRLKSPFDTECGPTTEPVPSAQQFGLPFDQRSEAWSCTAGLSGHFSECLKSRSERKDTHSIEFEHVACNRWI